MDLENIALIASIISGLTAVTTSLRAIGKSREIARNSIEARLREGCRSGGCGKGKLPGGGSLLIHLISTIIWFALSAAFAVPVYIEKWSDGADFLLWIWISPFALLIIVILYIWSRALDPDK